MHMSRHSNVAYDFIHVINRSSDFDNYYSIDTAQIVSSIYITGDDLSHKPLGSLNQS